MNNANISTIASQADIQLEQLRNQLRNEQLRNQLRNEQLRNNRIVDWSLFAAGAVLIVAGSVGLGLDRSLDHQDTSNSNAVAYISSIFVGSLMAMWPMCSGVMLMSDRDRLNRDDVEANGDRSVQNNRILNIANINNLDNSVELGNVNHGVQGNITQSMISEIPFERSEENNSVIPSERLSSERPLQVRLNNNHQQNQNNDYQR